MDLVVSAPTVALNPQQGAALPALRAGDVIEAQVLQAVGDAAKIAIGNTILEVLTQVALTPGATVKLAVSNTPQGLRLTLVGNGVNGGNTSAGDTTAAGASATAATPGSGAPGTAASGNSSTVTTAPNQPAATIVTTSAGAAQVAASADESGAAGPAAAQAVTTAGGAGIASATTNTAAAADPQAAARPLAPNPILAATAALAAAVQSSAARQGGLGPLFADAGVAAGLAAVPEPVRQAAERLLAVPPALDETLSADSVKQALDRSGLFFEARLSATANDAQNAAASSADDLKAALVVLRNVVKSWLANDLPISSALDGAMQGATPAAGAPNGRGVLMGLMTGDDETASSGVGAQDAAPRMPVGAAATTPPPPYRGAPTAAQPAAAPSISADTAPRDIGRVLLSETDAALARQTLLQAASLPDHASAANAAMMRTDPTSGPRWLFEVPFATPQGAAVAQFEIARDGHNAPAAEQKVAWRARFSLDVEPIGPVHAQIAVVGARAAVTLWAERPETSTQLRDNAPALADALRQAELDPGDVLVRAGTPPRPREAAPAGRFLDRAS
ncbi:MAG TPA: flagellar hook-length control protein FliK [Xanthobacteraceae bacterium]